MVAVVVAVAVVVGVAVAVAVAVAVVVGVGVGMSDRTQQARERAAEIIEALDEQDITWHSQGPWEHLGDACRDGRLMAEDALYLADRVAALETALRDLRDAALPVVISYENCKAWAEAVGDKWVGVPDVENLAAALAGGGGQTETPA